MSKSKRITVRVQSPDGTKRVEVGPYDTTKLLYEKVHDAFDLSGFGFALYRSRDKKDELISSRSHTVKDSRLGHGDMIYLCPLNGTLLHPDEASVSGYCRHAGSETGTSTREGLERKSSSSSLNQLSSNSSRDSVTNKITVKEDEVDLQLWKMDGKIQRQRDRKLCHHGPNGCCVHCSPLEPFDDVYLKEQNVKHMSFHAYLRKLTAGVDRGKFVALEDISCRIKPGCKDHPPWPKGICSKCQPNAITLNRQVYRHVDNVMFENPYLVERFLNYWRTTGHQRIGFLYGNYEVHTDVPLGIRATVAAIYEPPQESTRDSVSLLPDEREDDVENLAFQIGLRRVGWIFTDLVADDIKKGTVKHFRNIEGHFLSAEECIMAGTFQNKHPNPCRFSQNGYFGSKFVTVCVTGDASNQVHMEGYQISNQCMALVRDDCFVPTKDAPELGYVRESSDRQYVPDVYYKEKDSYGNEVPRLARPLPVEYLLVDVPASTPLNPLFTFHCDPAVESFPVENRLVDGHIQDFNALTTYLSQFRDGDFFKAVSDFHLLLYISTMEMLPLKECIGPLLEAVKSKDEGKAKDWARSEQWATVEQVIAASTSSGGPSSPLSSGAISGGSLSRVTFADIGDDGAVGGSVGLNATSSPSTSGPVPGNSASMWTCRHCTFLNRPQLNACDICSLPR
ncbi:nuclear protein localization protein 4 homolog [Ischnura elegans]|uniref:nuclear protein localization protein 4 homolog n=1 Tax=Ischnura elegans TaxID=197161 RepID=UPI001ED8B5DF|nr:nuclear protein localization protein 4 homolog [Ischnura elegans]